MADKPIRRNKPKARIVYEITYYEMARRLLMKQDPDDIAQAMGLRLDVVKSIMRKPEFKAKVHELQEGQYTDVDREIRSEKRNLHTELERVSQDAFDLLEKMMTTAAHEGLRVRIAQDFMDRAGFHKAPERGPQIAININPIEADVIATAMHKMKEGRKAFNIEKLPVKTAEEVKEIKYRANREPDRESAGPTS